MPRIRGPGKPAQSPAPQSPASLSSTSSRGLRSGSTPAPTPAGVKDCIKVRTDPPKKRGRPPKSRRDTDSSSKPYDKGVTLDSPIVLDDSDDGETVQAVRRGRNASPASQPRRLNSSVPRESLGNPPRKRTLGQLESPVQPPSPKRTVSSSSTVSQGTPVKSSVPQSSQSRPACVPLRTPLSTADSESEVAHNEKLEALLATLSDGPTALGNSKTANEAVNVPQSTAKSKLICETSPPVPSPPKPTAPKTSAPAAESPSVRGNGQPSADPTEASAQNKASKFQSSNKPAKDVNTQPTRTQKALSPVFGAARFVPKETVNGESQKVKDVSAQDSAQEKAELQHRARTAEEQVAKLQSELRGAIRTLEDARKESRRHEAENQSLKTANSEQSATVTRLEAQSHEIESLRKGHASSKEDNDRLKENNDRLREEADKLKNRLQEQETLHMEVSKAFNEARKELETIKETLTTRDETIAALAKQLKESAHEVEALKGTNEKSASRIKSLDDHVKGSVAALEERNKQITDLQGRLKSANELLKTKQVERNKLMQELEKEKSGRLAERSKTDSELHNTQLQLQECMNEVTLLEDEKKKRAAEMGTLYNQLDTHKTALKDAESQHLQKTFEAQKLQKMLQEFAEQRNKLQTDMQISEQVRKALSENLAKTEKQLNKVRSKVWQGESEMEALKKKTAEDMEKQKQLMLGVQRMTENKLRQREEELKGIKEERDELVKSVEELQKKVSEEQGTVTTLFSKLRNAAEYLSASSKRSSTEQTETGPLTVTNEDGQLSKDSGGDTITID
ncbi:hypothetical protein QBC46DRAFT_437043 [Diplogelasinospora grovesii]|uniref:Uncharacterized protein n=1 Tax=Diplogelasinospora grovesii TaxID=303347 RepID=A0AAN6N692_9PEZI|nr:hypothetical protein QBC46DRAFT_437043 [Diplogelasinospora grovesii]